MRLAAPGYRFFFVLAVLVAVAAMALAAKFHRNWKAANEEVALRNEMNPFAISLSKTRDREYTFIVENYGYQYRGTTGNLIDDSVLVFGAWEKHILLFLEDYTNATGTQDTAFVDVGANTGQYALFMSRRVKLVHAVEPFPPVLKNLHANIKLNSFTNIKVHEVGLGDQVGSIPFYEPVDANHGGGTFRGEGHDGKGQKLSAQLPIVTGDSLFTSADGPPIGSMKIDIEGFEEAALKGLRQTLEKYRPLVVVEVSTPPAGSIASLDHLKSLFPANYEFFVLVENQKQFISGRYEVVEFPPVAEAFFKEGGQRNLIAVSAEKSAKLPRQRPN
ncbi:MAG: FkbM family methyltransferase [Planctomycetia bacterium]|nr:FkbM family methyltransferase [Planctomycetia bacterium]